MSLTINMIEGKCSKCRKATFIMENNKLCFKCAGKIACERIKNAQNNQEFKSDKTA